MKIILIGNVEFSSHILNKIYSLVKNYPHYEMRVITSKKNSFNSDYCDLTKDLKKFNIKYLLTNDINSNKSFKFINSFKPDIGFCVGWSRLLKKRIIKIPSIGFIGYHPALLPMNRGRHPLIWSLVLGLEETGSTFFMLDKNADSGRIVSQKIIKISKKDNAFSLYAKMIKKATSQIDEIFKKLQKSKLKSWKQNSSKMNLWRKRSYSDGQIDWRMNAESIYNLVRALSKPYPGAHIINKNKEYKLWSVKIVKLRTNSNNIEPGKVVKITKKGAPVVKCGNNFIEIKLINPKLHVKLGDYI